MEIKRYFKAIFILLSILALTGCQLAREDLRENKTGDRLIGVFVTTESLNLFNTERYLKDHIEGGRLYATLKDCILPTTREGKQEVIKDFVFEDVEGVSFFAATVATTPEVDSFITSGSDPAISDRHMSVSYADEEEKTTLEGTIYRVLREIPTICYINPVYQSSDGSVYAMSGSGFRIDSITGVKESYTQTLDETTMITEKGKKKKVSISIKISIATMFSPDKVVMLHMDKDSKVLLRQEYIQGQIPEALVLGKDTDYIVVETYSHDKIGEAMITRELFDKNEKIMTTFFEREDGVCEERHTQLKW